jgi:hypothetical protein
MTMKPRALLFGVLVPLALVIFTRPATTAQGNLAKPERFTALAVNFDSPPGAAAAVILDITVKRWSTDAERDLLFTALMEKGSDKLLDVLKGMPPVGTISATGNLGYDLHYARHTGGPDRLDQITLITDRPIGFAEASRQSRTLDYPFTIIDMRINSAGKGDGKLLIGAKIQMDRDTKTIVLEHYNAQPVQLTSVKRENAGR